MVDDRFVRTDYFNNFFDDRDDRGENKSEKNKLHGMHNSARFNFKIIALI